MRAASATGTPGTGTATRVAGASCATRAAKRTADVEQVLPAQSPRDRDAQGPPVDGDREAGPEDGDGTRGGEGVHVTRAEVQAPPGHRQDRHVQPARHRGQLRHLRELRGVAGEVHGARPPDQVADRLGARSRSRLPSCRAGVTSTLHAAQPGLGPDGQLEDRPAGVPPQQRPPADGGRRSWSSDRSGGWTAGRCGRGAGGTAAPRRPTPGRRRPGATAGAPASAAARPGSAARGR